jgi:hypothetical protein
VSTLDDWTTEACDALSVDRTTVDVSAILDLARDVAHGVARPAAPLTAYLVGLAVGRGADYATAVATITALAESWPPAATTVSS